MSDDRDIRDEDLSPAAEHALGVLDAEGRRAAEARVGSDAAFRADLRAWEDRLAPLADELAPIDPPARLWGRIEASTAATPLEQARRARDARSSGGLWNSVGFWRAAAGGLGALAAASLAFAVMVGGGDNRPPSAEPPPMMLAELASADGGSTMFVISYDPARRLAMITPMPGHTPPAGHSMELWLIPAGQSPRSLGVVRAHRPAPMPMPAELQPLMGDRVTLAVTVEPAGGSPTGRPSGAPVAAGALSRL